MPIFPGVLPALPSFASFLIYVKLNPIAAAVLDTVACDLYRCTIKIFWGGGRGGDTFKTPSPTNNFCLYPPPVLRCFWKDPLMTPTPHFKHLSLLPTPSTTPPPPPLKILIIHQCFSPIFFFFNEVIDNVENNILLSWIYWFSLFACWMSWKWKNVSICHLPLPVKANLVYIVSLLYNRAVIKLFMCFYHNHFDAKDENVLLT